MAITRMTRLKVRLMSRTVTVLEFTSCDSQLGSILIVHPKPYVVTCHVTSIHHSCLSIRSSDQSLFLSLSLLLLYSHPPVLPLMRGKRAQIASSSPQYERVIWVEKKTARGSKITAEVSGSPRTPKFRKQTTPLSKKRRMEDSSVTPMGLGVELDQILDPIIPINFKMKRGKVCTVILTGKNHI